MPKHLSHEKSRSIVTQLLRLWAPDAPDEAVGYAASYLFDAGTLIPLQQFSLWGRGLRCAWQRAGLSPGATIMMFAERTHQVRVGNPEEIADIILDTLKGDASIVLFDDSQQWALAVNHDGALSVLGRDG